jgi:hypothetical protein
MSSAQLMRAAHEHAQLAATLQRNAQLA